MAEVTVWCSLDVVDVLPGPSLVSDPDWGYVHESAFGWHTIRGFPLERVEDKSFRARPLPNTRGLPGVAAIRFDRG